MMTQILRRSMVSHKIQDSLLEVNRQKINAAIEAQFEDGCDAIVVTLDDKTNKVTVNQLLGELQLAGWVVEEYRGGGQLIINKK